MAMLRLGFSSTVLPLALRAISSPRIRCLSITKAALATESPIVSDRHFSTDSAKTISRKVIGAIKSEIKSNELALMKSRGAPVNLPFTIEDDPRYCHIMLKRDFYEEKIDVTVNPIHDIPKDEVSDDDDGSSSTESDSDDNSEEESDSDDNSEESSSEKKEESSGVPPQSVLINVSIIKENKGTLDLGVHVSADKIVVHRISFTEPNHYHLSLRYSVEADGELQHALSEFVKMRGIEKCNVGFLYNYMVEKRKQWGTLWTPGRKPDSDDFKNLKKFIEEW